MDLGSIILDTICDRAYQNGFKEGMCSEQSVNKKEVKQAYNKGFNVGLSKGRDMAADILAYQFGQSGTVIKVVFDGDKTVVKFADGGHEIVYYHPEYGYAYDAEKAIMAGILKHLVGNSYIKPLKQYAHAGVKHCSCSCNCNNNLSVDMIQRVEDDGYAHVVPEIRDYNMHGEYVNLTDDELLLRSLDNMDDDIFES